MLDKKLIHVVYSKLDRDVLVMAMPAEKYVFKVIKHIDNFSTFFSNETRGIFVSFLYILN